MLSLLGDDVMMGYRYGRLWHLPSQSHPLGQRYPLNRKNGLFLCYPLEEIMEVSCSSRSIGRMVLKNGIYRY